MFNNRKGKPCPPTSATPYRLKGNTPLARACAAFHTAQAAVVALKDEDQNYTTSKIVRGRRRAAFQTVRSLPARSGDALKLKVDIMFILEESYGPEDADVGQFAIELVREASRIFLEDTDAKQSAEVFYLRAVETGGA